MIILFIIVLTLAAIGVDLYIYRRITSRYRVPRGIKILYIAVAFLVDTLVMFSLIRMRVADVYSAHMMRSILWAFGIFFLNLVPKLLYTIFSLIDYPVGSVRKKRSVIFGWIGLAIAVFAAGNIVHGLTLGRSQFRVETVELRFESLPPEFDGLRVVQFSDLHLANIVKPERFITRMVDIINGLSPDIVIQSGDIVNTSASEIDAKAERILSGIRSTYGVYCVLGNHDLGIYVRDTVRNPIRKNIEELIAKQEELGWVVLENQTTYIHEGADSIAITGLGYPYDPRLNASHVTHLPEDEVEFVFSHVPDSIFDITISHAPQLWDKIIEQNKADLTLAGHVHSMQMKFGFGKRKWSPARWVYERWSGLYEESGKYLYINDGVGYVMYPMRIGTKPEITLFILRSK